MPFVEYSGKVLPASGEKDFEKGPQGYELSSVKDMADRLGNDWWHLPAAAIGAAGLGAAGKAVYDWYSAKSQPPATRIEPTLLEPAAPAAPIGPRAPSPGEQVLGTKITDPAERRLADMYAAQQQARGIAPAAPGAVPPPAPVPTAPAPAAMPPAAVAPSTTPVAPAATQLPPAPLAAPVAPAAPAAPIPTTFAGATVTEPPVAAPTAPAKPPKTAKTAVPGIAPPEGLTAPQKSAFNYIVKSQKELGIKDPAQYVEFVKQVFAGQTPEMGPKGGAPVGFKEKMGEMKKSEMIPLSKPERDALRARGIDIPSSQRGAISVPQLLGLLGNTVGAVGLAQAYNRGQQTGDWSDFGLSAVGQILANIAPRAATPFALMSPGGLNTGEQEELARRRGMAPTID